MLAAATRFGLGLGDRPCCEGLAGCGELGAEDRPCWGELLVDPHAIAVVDN